MIRILNTEQIRALDAHTIRKEPIASIDLMERACRAFVNWFVERFDPTEPVGVVCGTGNNGGDGLAIARLLVEFAYDVKVWVIRGGTPESADFKINFERLKQKHDINEVASVPDKGIFDGSSILVDALFGSGLSRPANGLYAEIIQAINEADVRRIAVDIPSGLCADKPATGDIVRADYTVSFQLPKLAFFLPQPSSYCGEWTTVDIGLDRDFIRSAETKYSMSTIKSARRLLKPRARFDHKGTYGHALLIAGSFGKIGAAVLSARAAVRSGVGLLTVHVPASGYSILQSTVPEAMAFVDPHDRYFTQTGETERYSAIGAGPGLGVNEETARALHDLMKRWGKPMVLDADALNILAMHPEFLQDLPKHSILTPHPKEFERLAGRWKDDFERLDRQVSFAVDHQCIVVLKGAFTSIALPDGNVVFNSTGNPGMATGGTGDILTGILTGLLAQGYAAVDAATLGVFLHGLAGDLAIPDRGMHAMQASDLVEFLPQAFRRLTGFRS